MKANPQHRKLNSQITDVCITSCRNMVRQIERVKSAIAKEFSDVIAGHKHVLELAMNEAEALAWQSGVPQLVFPSLAMEKARDVAEWHARQQSMLSRDGQTFAVR